MKRTMQWLALGLTLLMLMTSCHEKKMQPQADTLTESAETEAQWQFIDFDEVSFATERQKRIWCRALSKTLRSLRNSYYDPYYEKYDGDFPGYLDLDGLLYGHSIALFDADMDGVPDLLIDMGGGSAANQEFIVYDIFTGEPKGDFSSGWEGNACTYYHTESGTYSQITEYTLRGGFDTRYHYVCRRAADSEEELLFHATYSLQRELIKPDGVTVTDVKEYWIANRFKHLGEYVDADTYLSEHEHFTRTHVRIPQTEMRVFDLGDLTEDFDDRDLQSDAEYMLTARGAKKLARKLMYSGQDYIRK